MAGASRTRRGLGWEMVREVFWTVGHSFDGKGGQLSFSTWVLCSGCDKGL
jgi:hypothetical protein